MESEWDYFKAQEQVRRKQGERNRIKAESDFKTAKDIAERSGLKLKCCSDVHYQIIGKDWVVNLYPGNGRIHADKKKRGRAPFLNLPPDWSLIDAVKACVGW